MSYSSFIITFLSMKHLLPLLFLLLLTSTADAQSRTSLFGWEEQTKLMILDQSHNYGNQFYDRGLFRFITPPMTKEHDFDLITYDFSTADDHNWYYSDEDGFRSFAGSFDLGKFLHGAQIRNNVQIADKMTFPLQLIRRFDMRSDRSIILLGLDYQISDLHAVGVSQTLTEQKSDLDATFYYRFGSLKTGGIQAEVSFLDWPNNAIYGLSEKREKDFEEERKYLRHAYLFSFKASTPIWNNLRGEAMAGVLTRSKAQTGFKSEPENNTLDQQNAWYSGFLAEWVNDFATVSLTWRNTYSKFDRENFLSEYDERIDYGTVQIRNNLGGYVSARYKNLTFENWVSKEFNNDRERDVNPRQSIYRNMIYSPFNYREKRINHRHRIMWQPEERGFITGLEWNAEYRSYYSDLEYSDSRWGSIRAFDYRQLYPFHIVSINERLTVMIGYRFTQKSFIILGISYDVDGDREGGNQDAFVREPSRFDGGFGRFIMYF
jgi:hypothetical protein